MRRVLLLLVLAGVPGCQVWNTKAVRLQLAPLRGKPLADVAKSLCDECEPSRDRSQAICRVHWERCSGWRYSRVKLFFDADGNLQTWQSE